MDADADVVVGGYVGDGGVSGGGADPNVDVGGGARDSGRMFVGWLRSVSFCIDDGAVQSKNIIAVDENDNTYNQYLSEGKMNRVELKVKVKEENS